MAAKHLLLQCLLGIQCKDFAMIAADQTSTEGILVMQNDEDKIHEVSDRMLMGMNGDAADRTQFSQFLSKNLELYKMRNHYELGAQAITHFARKNLMDALHSGSPYILNLLLACYDEVEGGLLHTVDFLATSVKVPFAAHGIAGLLGYSILSDHYKPDLTEAEAYEVLQLCVREVHKRLFMNLPNFIVKAVSKDGVRTLPIIVPTSM